MIQPLRRAHQKIMVGLAIVLPTIFAAGVVLREPVPPVSEPLPGRQSLAARRSDVIPFRKVLAPGLLIYWADVAPSDANLPSNAQLLGSVHSMQSSETTPVSNGYFLAYSLADRRVVAYEPVSREPRQP